MIRRDGLTIGAHLRETTVAAAIGTSRSPVQVSLRWLASMGVLRKDAHRGYFLAKDPRHWRSLIKDFAGTPDDPLYLQIAQARQTNIIAREISEAALMRHFKVARSPLRKVLARIAEEGWAEQRVGHGWHFLPMIDSPDAYEESYFFRQAIEPAGLLSPSFRADPQQLADIQREQEAIAQDGYLSMTAIELFEANRRFHETLAACAIGAPGQPVAPPGRIPAGRPTPAPANAGERTSGNSARHCCARRHHGSGTDAHPSGRRPTQQITGSGSVQIRSS